MLFSSAETLLQKRDFACKKFIEMISRNRKWCIVRHTGVYIHVYLTYVHVYIVVYIVDPNLSAVLFSAQRAVLARTFIIN